MKFLSFALLFFLTALRVKSQIYTSNNVNVHFFSPAIITDIDAQSNAATAILNSKKKEVKVTIPIASFSFKKALMQQHFNEIYLESKKYPTSTFRGNYKEYINLQSDGVYQVDLTGKFNLHGVDKVLTIPCNLTIKNGAIVFDTDFKILIKDYKIDTPKMLNKEFGQEINVTVNGVLAQL